MNGTVYSMTGFAIAKHTSGISMDIRSVNSRFLDLSFKLPDAYRHLENKLREIVGAQIRRGKCEVRLVATAPFTQSASNALSASSVMEATLPPLDVQAVKALLAQQAVVHALAPNAALLTVAEIIHLTTLVQHKHELPATAHVTDADVVALCQVALSDFNAARSLEGGKLAQLMLSSIQVLHSLRDAVLPLVPALVQQQRQRFLQKFTEALLEAGGKISTSVAEERALTEATAFAIRIDVTEEVDRLGSHLTEIENLLTHGGHKKGQEMGKRLEFLIQELHREANTLGSKSATLATTQIAVDMKVLIEQLREQIQNIE
jgi:uncharacterized protein (TIGR00255 family)